MYHYNMTQNLTTRKKEIKQRVTAFVDPTLVKRAKIRGALEELTISEVVEKALDAFTPKIEKNEGQEIKLKFMNNPVVDSTMSPAGLNKKTTAKS